MMSIFRKQIHEFGPYCILKYSTTNCVLKKSIIPEKYEKIIESVSRLVPNARMALDSSKFIKTNNDIYKCNYSNCDYSTTSSLGLKIHIKTAHKKNEKNQKNAAVDSDKKSNPMTHKCSEDNCDFSSDNPRKLNRHLRDHVMKSKADSSSKKN